MPRQTTAGMVMLMAMAMVMVMVMAGMAACRPYCRQWSYTLL